MKYGINLLLWTGDDTEERMLPVYDSLAEMGYDGVELMIWTDPVSQDPRAVERLAHDRAADDLAADHALADDLLFLVIILFFILGLLGDGCRGKRHQAKKEDGDEVLV